MSDLDRRWIRTMRELGVLGDEEISRLPTNIILVCCVDGDQIDEVFDHYRDAVKSAGGKPRIHTVTEVGGAMGASPKYPLFRGDDVPGLCLKKITALRELKGANTAVLSVHAPCGAARLAKLGIVELIAHMIAAKRSIKSQMPDLKILCMLHVDYEDGTKRTYVVSRERWDLFYHDYLEDKVAPSESASRATGIMPAVQVTEADSLGCS